MNRDLGEMTEKISHADHIEIKIAGEVTEHVSQEEDSQQERSTSGEKDPEKAGKEKGEEDMKGSLRDLWRRKSLLMKRSRKVGFGSSARRDTPP